MRYVKFLIVPLLFVSLAFMNVGGCGSSGNGGGGQPTDPPPTQPPPTDPPPTNPPPTDPPPTNPPPECSAPPLTEDYGDMGVFFVDSVHSVLIGMTSDGNQVAITLSDIPDSGALIGAGANVLSENFCDIFIALVDGVSADAGGTCIRSNIGQTFALNDFDLAGIPLGVDLTGQCFDVVTLSGQSIEQATRNFALDMVERGETEDFDSDQSRIADFLDEILNPQ